MTAVFVNGFDFETSPDDIEKHFSPAGNITDVRQVGKGAAVVTYSSADEADRAISDLNETTMEGNRRYVTVRLDGKGGDKGKGKGKYGDSKGKGGGKYGDRGDYGGKSSDRAPIPYEGDLQEGTVATFFDDKGFGFVTPDDGSEDVFVHVKENPDLEGAQAGDAVMFDSEYDDRKGKYKGTNLSLKSGGGGGGGGGGKGKGKGYSPW